MSQKNKEISDIQAFFVMCLFLIACACVMTLFEKMTTGDLYFTWILLGSALVTGVVSCLLLLFKVVHGAGNNGNKPNA